MLESAFRRLAATVARLRTRDFLAIFNYHQVTPAFDPQRHGRKTWTALDYFDRQLALIDSNFRIAALPDAVAELKSGALRGATAALTFDDGDISLATHVVPLLRRRGLPATFFVNSAYWGECRLHWAALTPSLATEPSAPEASCDMFAELRETRDPQRYRALRQEVEERSATAAPAREQMVSKRFLGELDPGLFSIGLHGHEHQRFSMMPAGWQRECIERNLEQLSDLPGFCPLFAVPFGRPHDWDDTVVGICRELGLELMLCDGGINRPRTDRWNRITADGAPVLGMFRHSLVGW